MSSPWNPESWRFDIDYYLNPFIPSPPWRILPYPVAYMLGHRRSKPRDIGTVVPILWAFVGIFSAISIICVVSERIPSFKAKGAPMIIGSFGAGAVLEFYAIESPLAQPRNFLVGQLVAATVGMGICKLFQMSADFDSIRWVAGAISCALVTSIMALTKTIHPPAGATALLAVADDTIVQLGWFFIPVVLLNCGIMLVVAMLINNIQRVYPSYWWTPEDLDWNKTDRGGKDTDEESKAGAVEDDRIERTQSVVQGRLHEIIIRPGQVILPHDVYLMQEELQLLEEIGNRL